MAYISPCASVAKDDRSQYMYDWESGPVVCTKKYGKKEVAKRLSSQSIAPGSLRSNRACMMMDQIYTPTLRTTTV